MAFSQFLCAKFLVKKFECAKKTFRRSDERFEQQQNKGAHMLSATSFNFQSFQQRLEKGIFFFISSSVQIFCIFIHQILNTPLVYLIFVIHGATFLLNHTQLSIKLIIAAKISSNAKFAVVVRVFNKNEARSKNLVY